MAKLKAMLSSVVLREMSVSNLKTKTEQPLFFEKPDSTPNTITGERSGLQQVLQPPELIGSGAGFEPTTFRL